MTREQFERARELDEEIQKYADLIREIEQGVFYKEKADDSSKKNIEKNNGRAYNDHSERWTLSKFFTLKFKKQKVVAIPHYEFAQGIEMDADAELIKVILDYLERKKKECEEEFEQIGGNG